MKETAKVIKPEEHVAKWSNEKYFGWYDAIMKDPRSIQFISKMTKQQVKMEYEKWEKEAEKHGIIEPLSSSSSSSSSSTIITPPPKPVQTQHQQAPITPSPPKPIQKETPNNQICSKDELAVELWPSSIEHPKFRGKRYTDLPDWKTYIGTCVEERLQKSKARRKRVDFESYSIIDSGFYKEGDLIAVNESGGVVYATVIRFSEVFMYYKPKYKSMNYGQVVEYEPNALERNNRVKCAFFFHMNPRPCPVRSSTSSSSSSIVSTVESVHDD